VIVYNIISEDYNNIEEEITESEEIVSKIEKLVPKIDENIPRKNRLLSYSKINDEILSLKNLKKNSLVFLSPKTHKYFFCDYLEYNNHSNTSKNNKTTSKIHKEHKELMTISSITNLKSHYVINKINKKNACEKIHLAFLLLAEKFLNEENDYKKLNLLFLKEDLVYKADEEEEETKKYNVKSKKKIVSEQIKFQIKEIAKFDDECEFKKYCEWSVDDVFDDLNIVDRGFDYEILVHKLGDPEITFWHDNQ